MKFLSKIVFFHFSLSENDKAVLITGNICKFLGNASLSLLSSVYSAKENISRMDVSSKMEDAIYKFQPPKSWYKDENHQKLFKDAIKSSTHLLMDETSYLLLSILTLFQQCRLNLEDPQKVLEIQDYFKRLLYRYLRSKIGLKNVNSITEQHLCAVYNLHRVDNVIAKN